MNIDEIKILYSRDFKRTHLFGQGFVERNKDNCFLIIEGKEVELKEEIECINDKTDIFEIKLKGITNITNMSEMFSDCVSLLSLSDIDKWNISNVTNMSNMFFFLFFTIFIT